MATLMDRAIGAARLDATAYEDVEADPSAMGQAMVVVVVASVASGLGSAHATGMAGGSLVGGAIGALVGWFVWAVTIWLVGAKLLPEPSTHADLGQTLRTTGFAAAPGVLGLLGFLPLLGGLVLFAVSIWQVAAMVVAVRQAFDYTSTGRAVAVCVVGFLIQAAIVVGLLWTLWSAMDGARPTTVL